MEELEFLGWNVMGIYDSIASKVCLTIILMWPRCLKVSCEQCTEIN